MAFSYLRGLGDGTFTNLGVVTTEFSQSVRMADLNKDGHIDFVGGRFDNQISIVLGVGDGTFGAADIYYVSGNPKDVEVADMDGDGNLDVIIAVMDIDQVWIYPGNGDGTLDDGNIVAITTKENPSSIAIADIDKDLDLDMVVGRITENSPDTQVFLMQTALSFTFEQPAKSLNTIDLKHGADIALADINKDQNIDFIYGQTDSDEVEVWLGSGDGTFLKQAGYPTGFNPHVVIVEDLDGDENLDIISVNTLGRNLSVLMGKTVVLTD